VVSGDFVVLLISSSCIMLTENHTFLFYQPIVPHTYTTSVAIGLDDTNCGPNNLLITTGVLYNKATAYQYLKYHNTM